ncbi:MAG: excisionase [Amphritea sp.]
MKHWLNLKDWDQANYPSCPHSLSTLRNWAKDGKFNPPAEKHGREWVVRSDAVFQAPNRSRLTLLKQAKAMTDDLAVHPVGAAEIDVRVLEIMSNVSTQKNQVDQRA